MTQVFWQPSLCGGRFENCIIPLEFLKDLSVFEKMIFEVAKSEYRKANPDRQRIPSDFAKGIEIGLTAVEAGSTKPVFSLILTSALFIHPNIHYFEKARDVIVSAVQAASEDNPISPYISEEAIACFDRLGRGLRTGESLNIYSSQGSAATLTKDIRKRILLASPKLQEYSEEYVVRGMIPEIDQDKLTFQLLLFDGRKITVPYTIQHEQIVMDAVVGYRSKQTKVILNGVGIISRQGRLLKFESLESIDILDPLDIFVQIESMRSLKDGWLEGTGTAPSESGLSWLADSLDCHLSDKIVPYLYPTEDGGIQAEWSLNGWESSLEIDIDKKSGYWHALHLANDIDEENMLDLNTQEAWKWLVKEILSKGDAFI